MAAPLTHDTIDYDYCFKPDRDWNNSSLPTLLRHRMSLPLRKPFYRLFELTFNWKPNVSCFAFDFLVLWFCFCNIQRCESLWFTEMLAADRGWPNGHTCVDVVSEQRHHLEKCSTGSSSGMKDSEMKPKWGALLLKEDEDGLRNINILVKQS